jgi:hypothetical protein
VLSVTALHCPLIQPLPALVSFTQAVQLAVITAALLSGSLLPVTTAYSLLFLHVTSSAKVDRTLKVFIGPGGRTLT